MKKHKKLYSIISVALAIVLVLSTVTVLAVKTVQDSKKTLLEKVLEEDGFLYGINYVWLDTGHTWADNEVFGHTTNTFSDGNGEEWVKEDMYNIKQLGFNCVQTIALGLHCEGILYGENGEILGLSEEYKENYRKYIAAISEAGMNYGVIIQFHETNIYETLGKEAWDKATQYYCNPEVRKVYLEKCVTPVLEILDDYKDNLLYVSLGDELEGMINDSEMQVNTENGRAVFGVSFKRMYEFISELNDLVKEKLPEIPRTTASNYDWINKYEDLDLTFIGHNYYSNGANVKDISTFKTSLPMIMSEWGMASYVDEVSYNSGTIKMLENIKKKGYKGAMHWMYNPSTGNGLWSLHNNDFKFRSDFNHLGMQFMFAIRDGINEYKGVDAGFETATMFYNAGKGRISWANSREAVKFDLERSTDGGKTWTKIITGADVEDYVYENNEYMGTYIDEELEVGKKASYRVVSYNEEGESNTSEATNDMERASPNPELIVNGGFENGLEGWTVSTNEKNKSEVTDAASCDGEKSLLLKSDAAWDHVYQIIPVKKNTTYRVSYNYKVVPGNKNTGCALFVMDKYHWEGVTKIGEAWLSHEPSTPGGWCSGSIVINSGNFDQFSIQLTTNDPSVPYYIDNISVVEVS